MSSDPSFPASARRSMHLLQAIDEAPTLAQLAAVARASQARLDVVRRLLPPALASGLKAGGLEDGVWSLLAPNNAAAAKLRQLLPRLESALQNAELAVQKVRIKVLQPI